MVNRKQIKGDIYNLTLNQQSIIRGWNLIVSDDGEEYLMFRNLSLSSKLHRRIYQTDLPMIDYRVTKELPKDKGARASFLGIFAAVLSGSVIRSMGLESYIFGASNIPVDFFIAIRNLSVVVLVIALFLSMTAFLRFLRLKWFLSQKGHVLNYVGKIKPLSPYRQMPNGREYW